MKQMEISDGTIPTPSIPIPIPLTVVRFRFRLHHKIMASISIPWGFDSDSGI